MNKLVILLLVVCLVSVHAFVKRDAPAASNNGLDESFKKLQEVGKDIGEKLSEFLSPDNIKKGVNDFTNQVNSALDKLKSNSPPEKA